MFTDPVVSTIINALPNKSAFLRPMSKDARALLTTMIHWSTPWPGVLPKFAAQYDPIAYEEACQKYVTFKYKDLLKGHKPKTHEEVLDILTLRNLQNYEWSSKLQPNVHRVGLISLPRSADVYRWLTSHFLLTDFNGYDLNKISYLGDEKFSLEVIKQEAARISDPDKHSVPYLYAIIVDVTERGKIASSKEQQTEKRYSDKLTRLIQEAAEPKMVHKFDGDETSRWERERQYLDFLENKNE